MSNHVLRKIDSAIDFTKIYDLVEDLYCEDNGRPSVDPVVLFKIVLLQHIFAIPSLRRTLDEVNLNVAYRWFIGYSLNKNVTFILINFNLIIALTCGFLYIAYYRTKSEKRNR